MPKSYLDEIKKEIEKLIKQIHNGRKPGNSVFLKSGKLIAETVSDSYKNITADFTTPDAEMLTRLTRDTWQFSAAKNYHELRDLSIALRDENGKLREFSDFKTEAEKISAKYNETWMRTEYNLAVASSQSAARWTEFEKEADVIPNLRYETVGDSYVRESHQLLDGIIRPMNDAFWNTHYPPNGYGCRCEAVQSLSGYGRVTKNIPDVPIPPLFRTNLAKTSLIYPKGHPYYKDVPKSEIRKSIIHLPPENTYVTVKIGDGKIDIHPLHGDAELNGNIEACKRLKTIDKNASIKLLPIIEEKDITAKKLYLPKEYIDKFPTKNPDLIYNNKVGEIEAANGGKSSIQNAIKGGKKQADFVLLQVPDDISLDSFDHIVKGQMKHYENKEDLTVWMFNNTGKLEYSTKQKRQ